MISSCLRLFFFICLGLVGSVLSYHQVHANLHFKGGSFDNEIRDSIESEKDGVYSELSHYYCDTDNIHHHALTLADVEEKEEEDKKFCPIFSKHISFYLHALTYLLHAEKSISDSIVFLNESKPLVHVQAYLLFEIFRI